MCNFIIFNHSFRKQVVYCGVIDENSSKLCKIEIGKKKKISMQEKPWKNASQTENLKSKNVGAFVLKLCMLWNGALVCLQKHTFNLWLVSDMFHGAYPFVCSCTNKLCVCKGLHCKSYDWGTVQPQHPCILPGISATIASSYLVAQVEVWTLSKKSLYFLRPDRT